MDPAESSLFVVLGLCGIVQAPQNVVGQCRPTRSQIYQDFSDINTEQLLTAMYIRHILVNWEAI
jgi:hypothetical protein